MATQWYYAHDGVRSGPFCADEMKVMAAGGGILLTDTVWKNDGPRGVPARKVEHLFAAPPAEALPEGAPAVGAVVLAEPPALPPEVSPQPLGVAASIPDDPPLLPETAAPAPPPPGPQHQVRKRRATASSGATVVGQDGTYVRFRKKCSACAHEDSSWQTLAIMVGMMKSNYFCPKCRKNREVVLRGSQD
jgi:hypothetical protein